MKEMLWLLELTLAILTEDLFKSLEELESSNLNFRFKKGSKYNYLALF
jgi:hypothetical protein